MKLSSSELSALSKHAEDAARAAGRYIQSRVDAHHIKHHKEDVDSLASQVVTEVDLKAQEIILSHLHTSITDQDLGLLTEEAADDNSRSDKAYFWCIDPLDGTLPFTERTSGYAVSVALITNEGDPVIGVVYIPDLDACYASIKGEGVRLNDVPFRHESTLDDHLHVYLDRSFRSESYAELVTSEADKWAAEQKLPLVQYHFGFGAVRNAIGVMTSTNGCYFKFPKRKVGGGSTWDFAATRLFFEELELSVSDFSGSKLHLNNPHTTFMSECGVLYATDGELAKFIRKMSAELAV